MQGAGERDLVSTPYVFCILKESQRQNRVYLGPMTTSASNIPVCWFQPGFRPFYWQSGPLTRVWRENDQVYPRTTKFLPSVRTTLHLYPCLMPAIHQISTLLINFILYPFISCTAKYSGLALLLLRYCCPATDTSHHVAPVQSRPPNQALFLFFVCAKYSIDSFFLVK